MAFLLLFHFLSLTEAEIDMLIMEGRDVKKRVQVRAVQYVYGRSYLTLL